MTARARLVWLAALALLATLLGCPSHVPVEAQRYGMRSPIGGPVHSPIQSPIPSSGTVPPKLIWSENFAAQSLGVATLPSGWVASISTPQYWETTAGAGLATSASTNVVVIGQRTSAVAGARFEGHTWNKIPWPLTWTQDSVHWFPLAAGTVTGGITGPDGASSAAHIVVTSGQQATESLGPNDDGSTANSLCTYYKAGGTSVVQATQYFNAAHLFAGLGSTWTRFCFNAFNGEVLQRYAPVDGSDHHTTGGTTAAAYDVFAGAPQAESRPSTRFVNPVVNAAGYRAPIVIQDSTTSASLRGRIRLKFAWSPSILAADCLNHTTWITSIGGSYYQHWSQLRLPIVEVAGDRNNAVYIDPLHSELVIRVDGHVARFTTPATGLANALPTWATDDQFTFDITFGNGPTVGTYTYNGGPPTSLGTAPALPSARWTGATLDWFSESDTMAAAEATIGSVAIYDAGPATTPTTVVYASTSGSGSTCTIGSPCSLTGAITAARTHLPATPGQVQVVLRGGTYRIGSTLAFTTSDSGLSIANYPGETPIISGHSLVTGSTSGVWTVDSGTVYKLPGVTGIDPHGGQLFVDGQRATLAMLAIADGGSWTVTGTGFTASTADAATIDALARPADVVVEMVGPSWRHYWDPLTVVSGATLTDTANAHAWAFTASTDVGFPMHGTYNATNVSIVQIRNAREWVTTPGAYYWNAGTSVLYWQAPAAWAAGTQYAVGVTPSGGGRSDARTNRPGMLVTNGGNIYQVVRGGYSATSGGPTGTGSWIVDNSVIWRYLSAVTSPTVETGVLDQLVTMTGVAGMTWTGVTFQGSSWSGGAYAPAVQGYVDVSSGVTGAVGDYFGVHGTYAEQMSAVSVTGSGAVGNAFYGCTFNRLAAAALAMTNGALGNTVSGCVFDDNGGVGIYEGDVTLAAAQQSSSALLVGNTITENVLTRSGQKWVASAAILRGYTTGSVITHNFVSDAGYGLQSGWGWGSQNASPATNMGNATVAWNAVIKSPTMGYLIQVDGAAIYTNGTEGAPCSVNYNYVESLSTIGIYVDNGKTQTTYEYNTFGGAVWGVTWCNFSFDVNQSIIAATGDTFINNYAPVCSLYPLGFNAIPTLSTVGTNFLGTSGISPWPGANTGPTSAAAIVAASGMSIANGLPANDNAGLDGLALLGLAVAVARRRRANDNRGRRAA